MVVFIQTYELLREFNKLNIHISKMFTARITV